MRLKFEDIDPSFLQQVHIQQVHQDRQPHIHQHTSKRVIDGCEQER